MNNKGADQTVRMRRLVCAFAVHIFSRRNPKIYVDLADGDTVDRDGLLYILQVCAHAYARLYYKPSLNGNMPAGSAS